MQKAMAATVLLLVLGIGAYAHHPFDEEFDWKKPVTVTGTVERVEMTNPHSYIYLNSTTGENKGSWKVELGAINMLKGSGWKDDSLKAGDRISVDGWLGKEDDKLVSARSITLPNGKHLPGGSSILQLSDEPTKREPAGSESR